MLFGELTERVALADPHRHLLRGGRPCRRGERADGLVDDLRHGVVKGRLGSYGLGSDGLGSCRLGVDWPAPHGLAGHRLSSHSLSGHRLGSHRLGKHELGAGDQLPGRVGQGRVELRDPPPLAAVAQEALRDGPQVVAALYRVARGRRRGHVRARVSRVGASGAGVSRARVPRDANRRDGWCEGRGARRDDPAGRPLTTPGGQDGHSEQQQPAGQPLDGAHPGYPDPASGTQRDGFGDRGHQEHRPGEPSGRGQGAEQQRAVHCRAEQAAVEPWEPSPSEQDDGCADDDQGQCATGQC